MTLLKIVCFADDMEKEERRSVKRDRPSDVKPCARCGDINPLNQVSSICAECQVQKAIAQEARSSKT